MALKTFKQMRKKIFYIAKAFPPRIKTNFYSRRQFFYMCRHVYTSADTISSTEPQLHCPIQSSRKPQTPSVTFPFMTNFCINLSAHKKSFRDSVSTRSAKCPLYGFIFLTVAEWLPRYDVKGKKDCRLGRQHS